MHDPASVQPADAAASASPSPKKPLDIVVKLALGVFVTAFALIWGGMFLSRPDRTIPPFSIGSQEGTVVAAHVPPWTTDSAIQTLIERFRAIGRETHDFARMKIQPTTPDDPDGRYWRITIFIFTHDSWAEPEMLHKYLTSGDPELRKAFDNAVRGYYRLDGLEEEGRIGPLIQGPDTPATAAYSQLMFKGPIPRPAAPPDGTPAP